MPEALSEDARRELDAMLTLCARPDAKGGTRLLFTNREALPAPFDAARHRRELHQLDCEHGVKLVERALDAAGSPGSAPATGGTLEWTNGLVTSDATGPTGEGAGRLRPGRARSPSQSGSVRLEDAKREAIDQLLDAVNGHARTLALLAPALRQRGVQATRTSLVE